MLMNCGFKIPANGFSSQKGYLCYFCLKGIFAFYADISDFEMLYRTCPAVWQWTLEFGQANEKDYD